MKDTIKIVSDTIKSVANSANSVNGKIATIDKNWFEILLENNPGVITILITGLVLPLGKNGVIDHPKSVDIDQSFSFA